MNCHICTRWTPEKGCDHYGPAEKKWPKRPFLVHLLIAARVNPDQYGLPLLHNKSIKSKIRLYYLHQTSEFNHLWDGPGEAEEIVGKNRSITKDQWKGMYESYRSYARESYIDRQLSNGVKR